MITVEPVKATRRIFLSFAATDRALALRLQTLLAEQTHWTVFRPDTLSAGEDWLARLKTEIEECDIFVVLITSASLNSSFVLSELGAAWGLEKPILPVFSQPEVLAQLPQEIRGLQAFSFHDLEQPDVIKRVFETYPSMTTSF